MTQLVIEDFEGTRTVVPLDMDALTIGRGAGHLIQLTEQNVSRDHAKFYLVDEGWVVEDLGSFNGVQVNNVKVQGPVMLREGDIITIGDYVMQLAGDASRDTVELVGAGIATDPYEGRAAEGAAGAPATGEAPVAPAGGASGPHGAVPAPASVEGITPAAGNIADAKPSIDDGLDEFEFDDDSSTGKKIFVVMSVIAIGATLFYAFGKSDEKSSPPKKTAVADNVDAKAEVPADDPDEEEVGAAAASTTAAEEPERGETGDTTQAETGTTGEEDAADAEEPEPVEAAPAPAPTPVVMKSPKKTSSTSSPAPAPKPVEREKSPAPKTSSEPVVQTPTAKTEAPKPVAPSKSAAELLAEARKAAMMGNASKAYDLAKQSNAKSSSADALQLMAVSACKMGSASKAKAAFSRLPEKKKKGVVSLCESKGITL